MKLTGLSNYLYQVLKILTIALLFPLSVAFFLGESSSTFGFSVSLIIFIVLLIPISYFRKGESEKSPNSKDGFMIVAFCWIFISLLGVFPYLISGTISDFPNAFFESVSGFTAVGTTILSNVETLSFSMLLWRSMTQWIGGVGVLVFVLALVPALAAKEKSVNIVRGEFTGPTPGKLVPRLRASIGIFISIYTGLTFLQCILLFLSGIPLFDSICIALTTVSTGGFSITSSSLSTYGSSLSYVIITLFMILAGINFNLFYFLFINKSKKVFRDSELRFYIGMLLGSTLLVTINLYTNKLFNLKNSLLHAGFQSTAFLSSTGLATTDFNLWPTFSKGLLLLLMLVGACSGSAGGGLKISRFLILIKESKRVLFRISHPRAVKKIQLDGKNIEENTISNVSAYFFIYIIVLGLSTLLLSLNGFDFESTFTAAAASLAGTGVGFGSIGPMGSYQNFSVFSKFVLCGNMLLGRLEIYPLILLFFPQDWKTTKNLNT